jgi:hypothetical protein
MAEDHTEHFQLNLNGISLEISGDYDFVQSMYRRVMRDIEEARTRMLKGERVARPAAQLPPEKRGSLSVSEIKQRERERPAYAAVDNRVIWLHRTNQMVNKIYMANVEEISKTRMLRAFDPDHLYTLYVEDPLLSKMMPRFGRGQTLWAELTTAGRRKIAEATGGYKALPKNARKEQP